MKATPRLAYVGANFGLILRAILYCSIASFNWPFSNKVLARLFSPSVYLGLISTVLRNCLIASSACPFFKKTRPRLLWANQLSEFVVSVSLQIVSWLL